MNAIFRKELRSSFACVIAPVFMALVICVMGGFLIFDQFTDGTAGFEYTLSKGAFWALLVTCILTMRTFSEERRGKTDQLLYYLPITSSQVVLGKFFAMLSIFAVPCVVFAIVPVFLSDHVAGGETNMLFTYGTLIGFVLLGCAVIAVSMFISALTENQLLCALLSLFTLAALYFLGEYIDVLPEAAWAGFALVCVLCLLLALVIYIATNNYTVAAVAAVVLVGAACVVYVVNSQLYVGLFAKILSAVCLFKPMDTIATVVNKKELLDWSAYIYYLSATGLFVFLTVQAFEKRRWN